MNTVVDISVGPATDTLRQLIAKSRPPFDRIFIDADKASYADYLETSLRLSRAGMLIIARPICELEFLASKTRVKARKATGNCVVNGTPMCEP
jgi:predicted O-methyltransferase YrrM